ncbi:tetratricopeptide repeat protein [Desulfuromonas sp. DDH964]|uniref:tetratricopeptide repeat protein n=1 Tax=Desulfuromonas sp. DDH964 TaxID=1823759 RepID=UPI0018D3DCDE|nr:tetratricopeptide repeat protein [Desulfuromonas sp. DDH964]
MLGKIAGYIEILSRDPHSTAFVPLADAYRQLGLLDDAIEVAQKGVAALPKFSPGFITLGRLHAQRGDLPAAEVAFSQAIAIEPDSLPALKGLARVSGMQGNRERARQLLEKANALQPDDATVLKMLAALGPAPQGEGKPARTPAPKSDLEERDAPIATATIAEIYVKQGLLGKALHVYRDLLKADPGNSGLAGRYRELEREISGEGAPAPIAGEAPAVEEEASVGSPAREESQILATLTSWLDAIRDRREDVR